MPARSTRMTRCSRAPPRAATRPRPHQFRRMTLSVVDRQRVAGEALLARASPARCRIESAGEQHDRRNIAPMRALIFRVHCPTGTCAAGSGSAPAGDRPESSRRARAPAAARGSARTARCSAAAARAPAAGCGSTRSRARSQITNLTRSCAVKQRQLLVAVATLLAASPASSRRRPAPPADRPPRAPSRRWSRAIPAAPHRTAASAASGRPSAPAARRR